MTGVVPMPTQRPDAAWPGNGQRVGRGGETARERKTVRGNGDPGAIVNGPMRFRLRVE